VTNQEKSGMVSAIAHAMAAFAHTPFPYLLGVALMMLATRWDGHIFDQKGCFQLQEIKGIIYKVDTCTGKAEELNPKNSMKTSSADAQTAKQ
jgi:hypothetical protein